MFQDEISKLVAQTLDCGHVSSGMDQDFLFNPEEVVIKKRVSLPDEVPGFFYHLEKKPSTFVIRILESENLAIDYNKILSAPQDYPSLRLLNDESNPIDCLKYFECDTVSIASVVKKQLSNKRFPIFEEHIFNVSDPSDSWWVSHEENELTIYFKLSRTMQIEKLTKIGPMGDAELATKTLFQFENVFGLLFPVKHFSCAHGQFNVSCVGNTNRYFKEFVNLFLTGQVGHEFWVRMWNLEFEATSLEVRKQVQAALYYFMELSVMRRFWSKIQLELI